jgi:hypothetical protein
MDKSKANKIKIESKNFGIQKYFNTASWNVHEICHKYREIREELKNMEVEVGVITETEKKLKVKILKDKQ